MTSEQYIPIGHEPREPRQHWVWAEMKAFDNGQGYADFSGEYGSYPVCDNGDGDKNNVEISNLQWLQIAAVNAPDTCGSVRAMSDPKFLSKKAQAHNYAYTHAKTTKEREQLGGLVSAIVVWGLSPEQLSESLTNFDPTLNISDL